MNVITGEALESFASQKSPSQYKKRFCFSTMDDFCHDNSETRILALYGLRRTGKTTLMAQQIMELNDYPHILWLQCDEDDDMQDIKDAIEDNPETKYIFIDEITKLNNFIQTGSVLSDIYASLGKKIIISGTDSLGIYQTEGRELFDRMLKISTTYIPFQEFQYLYENKTLDDYIKYGGTLTDGKIIYNKDNVDRYTNTAIAHNIEHSLERTGRDGEFGILTAMYDANELISFLNKIIELHNRTFLLKTIKKSFTAHDIGSLKNFVEKGKLGIEDSKALYNKDFLKAVEKSLEIKNELTITPTPQMMKQAKKWLLALDVIIELPATDEVIFTQPGIRYAQMEKQIELLMDHPVMRDAYTLTEREQLAKKLEQDIQGQLLEDIIFYQLTKDKTITKDYGITKYCERAGNRMHEFDIVLESKKANQAIALEVKHSQKETPEQRIHLESQEFCDLYQQEHRTVITGKAVIYMGKPKTLSSGISYVNASDFLKTPKKIVKNIIRAFNAAIVR